MKSTHVLHTFLAAAIKRFHLLLLQLIIWLETGFNYVQAGDQYDVHHLSNWENIMLNNSKIFNMTGMFTEPHRSLKLRWSTKAWMSREPMMFCYHDRRYDHRGGAWCFNQWHCESERGRHVDGQHSCENIITQPSQDDSWLKTRKWKTSWRSLLDEKWDIFKSKKMSRCFQLKHLQRQAVVLLTVTPGNTSYKMNTQRTWPPEAEMTET